MVINKTPQPFYDHFNFRLDTRAHKSFKYLILKKVDLVGALPNETVQISGHIKRTQDMTQALGSSFHLLHTQFFKLGNQDISKQKRVNGCESCE